MLINLSTDTHKTLQRAGILKELLCILHKSHKGSLLEDFQKRFAANKANLKKKLERPNPFGGAMALPKKQ